jgi:DNA-binding LytR/AlgR family response regulator
MRDTRDLAAVYRSEAQTARGVLAAADTGGRLLLANADARAYFGIAAPDRPWKLTDTMPQLHAALRTALDRAHLDNGWVGVGRLPMAGRDDLLPLAFRPAIRDHRLVGIMLTAPNDDTDGEALTLGDDVVRPAGPGRLVGLQGDRMVLVSSDEIRFAGTDGGNVWLHTDRGRLRVLERGFTALEERLEGQGFLRVHRKYLVNRRRVKEVAPAPNGCIQLLLDVPGPPVPVARRRSVEVRRSLTLP